jgi:nucleotide-binding universal stress UspA family protein
MGEDARKVLEKAKDKAEKNGVQCVTIVQMGDQPHKFIVQEAKERNIDLIAIGTHRRTGLKKLVMGSVAERVIGYAPCAVLVTPA